MRKLLWNSLLTVLLASLRECIFASAQIGSSCFTTTGNPGDCRDISSCTQLLRLLNRVRQGAGSNDDLRTLQRASANCGVSQTSVLVCCPITAVNFQQTTTQRPIATTHVPRIRPTRPPTRPPQPRPSRRPPPQTNNRQPGSRNPFPSNCGVNGITDRIIDGEDAELLAWPWMAVFRGRVLGSRKALFFCGGVLISDEWVLTAAHCFPPHIDLEFVRVGEHTLSKRLDCVSSPETQLCAPPVEDIPGRPTLHPQYQVGCEHCNDIALVKLNRPARLIPLFVVPICIPQNPRSDMGFSEAEFQGKTASSAGWGKTARDPNNPTTADVLQQVRLKIQRLPFCERIRRDFPNPNTILCAGGNGQDTCQGDSGGPLTLTNNRGTRHFVVGITSFGPSFCGTRDTQGVYTNVVQFIDWIRETMFAN